MSAVVGGGLAVPCTRVGRPIHVAIRPAAKRRASALYTGRLSSITVVIAAQVLR